MGSHPRWWTAIAQLMRINALIFLVIALVAGVPRLLVSIDLIVRLPDAGIRPLARDVLVLVVLLTLVWLLWTAKGALITGRPRVVRLLVGCYVVIGVVASAGLSLLALGAAYVITREPYAPSLTGARG